MPDDEEHDTLNVSREVLPRASGLRFYWWADDLDEDDPLFGKTRTRGRDDFPDPSIDDAAAELARSLSDLTGTETRWRRLLVGGAGENGAVELIATAGGAVALVTGLLGMPGKAKEAWEHISKFLKRTKVAKLEWDTSSEVAIVHCLGLIQNEWPGAYTNPAAVRVLEDGTDAGAFGDCPIGVHVIVIPDLQHRKTHIFAIDQHLVIRGRLCLDLLTRDAGGDIVAR